MVDPRDDPDLARIVRAIESRLSWFSGEVRTVARRIDSLEITMEDRRIYRVYVHLVQDQEEGAGAVTEEREAEAEEQTDVETAEEETPAETPAEPEAEAEAEADAEADAEEEGEEDEENPEKPEPPEP